MAYNTPTIRYKPNASQHQRNIPHVTLPLHAYHIVNEVPCVKLIIMMLQSMSTMTQNIIPDFLIISFI